MDQAKNRAPFRDGKSHQRIIDRFALGEGQHAADPWYEHVENDYSAFRRDRLQHIRDHIDLWATGDRRDDHLAAAIWGLLIFMHMENREGER